MAPVSHAHSVDSTNQVVHVPAHAAGVLSRCIQGCNKKLGIRTDEVARIPAHMAGVLVVGAHILWAEPQCSRSGAGVAEGARAQPDAPQPGQPLHLPVAERRER